MKIREFLTVPVKSLGGLLLYTIAGAPVRLAAQENGKVRIPLLFFTEAEARAVQAACARIFPSDESGPGATEANVIVYIDRQLAGPGAGTSIDIRKARGSSPFPNMVIRRRKIRSRSIGLGFLSWVTTSRLLQRQNKTSGCARLRRLLSSGC
jgi:hypothetical protein